MNLTYHYQTWKVNREQNSNFFDNKIDSKSRIMTPPSMITVTSSDLWELQIFKTLLVLFWVNRCIYDISFHRCVFSRNSFTYKLTCFLSFVSKEFHRKANDGSTIDQQKLPVPVFARYFRFNPTERESHNCLTVEIYGTFSELSPLFYYVYWDELCHVDSYSVTCLTDNSLK